MSCADCKLVCSTGILECCDFRPRCPSCAFYGMRTYPDFKQFLAKASKSHTESLFPTIYVFPLALPEFVNKFLPSISFPFVLVSGNYDGDMPVSLINSPAVSCLNTLLNNQFLKCWYLQNCVVRHSKIASIPIGLDYHTLDTGFHSWGLTELPICQEQTLFDIRSRSLPLEERILQCYTTCNLFFGRGHGQDRVDALKQIPASLLVKEDSKIPRITTWERQTKYAFVVSPHGNGLDCHRTWEALALGCIPIVKTSPIDNLFQDLPVLIVKQWTDVEPSLLKKTVARFSSSNYRNNLPKRLTLHYWTNCIRSGTEPAPRQLL